jgi:uncharacterized protein with beta-barrel porin domain
VHAGRLRRAERGAAFLFADDAWDHRGNLLEAQYVSVLTPARGGVLADPSPASRRLAHLDGRFTSAIGAPRDPRKLEVWAAYDYSAPDYSTNYFSGNGDVNTIAVGADMRLADKATVGIMFNYSENKSDYGGAGFKLREPMGTVYGAWADGPWHLGASLGAGNLDFSTTRNATLGAATARNRARPTAGTSSGAPQAATGSPRATGSTGRC